MRIIFICGSLEIGKDGVGDYTRQLAGEIIKEGHICNIIGLMDKGVEADSFEIQHDGLVNIEVLRLPYKNGFKINCHSSVKWVRELTPDWLSIQFVPFGYHNKGLPIGLSKAISNIRGNAKVHLMVHELWVGGNILKMQLYATIQRRLIINFIQKIHPATIHTHLPLFKKRLAQYHIRVKPLPLFSNIPIRENVKRTEIIQKFRIAFFSQVSADKKIISFLRTFYEDIKMLTLELELVFIGGNDNNNRVVADKLAKELSIHANQIIHTGFISNEGISDVLQTIHLGITPIPYHALGKSGTIAAFLTHAIPVAVPVIDDFFKSITPFFTDLDELVLFEPTWDCYQKIANIERKNNQVLNISRIANMFIDDLTNVENG